MDRFEYILKKNKSNVIALIDQGVISGTNFLFGILITRFSGLDTYGNFTLFWLIFLFLQSMSLAFIGLPSLVISNHVENKTQYLIDNLKLSRIVISTLIPIIYIGFSGFALYNPEYKDSLGFWLFPLTIVLFIKQDINRKYFYSVDDKLSALIINFIAYFLQLPILAIFAGYGILDFNNTIITLSITCSISNVVFLFLRKHVIKASHWRALPWKQNWNYSKYLLATNILQWFSGNYILATSGALLGATSVGVIRIIQNLMGILNVLFLTLENVIPAKASYLLSSRGKKHFANYIKVAFLKTGFFFIIILALTFIFGESLLDFFYGKEYASYSYLLQLFCLLYIFVFIGTFLQLTIKTLNKNKQIFFAYIITTIVSILLAKPLIENFDLVGVLIGFLLLQLITITIYFKNTKIILKWIEK